MPENIRHINPDVYVGMVWMYMEVHEYTLVIMTHTDIPTTPDGELRAYR